MEVVVHFVGVVYVEYWPFVFVHVVMIPPSLLLASDSIKKGETIITFTIMRPAGNSVKN